MDIFDDLTMNGQEGTCFLVTRGTLTLTERYIWMEDGSATPIVNF